MKEHLENCNVIHLHVVPNSLGIVSAPVLDNSACFFCIILSKIVARIRSLESGDLTYDEGNWRQGWACLGLLTRKKTKGLNEKQTEQVKGHRIKTTEAEPPPPPPQLCFCQERRPFRSRGMPMVGGWGLDTEHCWDQMAPAIPPCLEEESKRRWADEVSHEF